MQTLHQKETQEILFTKALDTHIKFVRLACMELNELCLPDEAISYYEIKNHDASKFSQHEFQFYARHLFGDKEDIHGWESALMHHYKNNAHHWQFHLNDFNVLYTEKYCTPEIMPSMQHTIMLADWLAAGRQYQDTWDFTDWINSNLVDLQKIIIHPQTRNSINFLLEKIGYYMSENENMYILVDPTFTDILKEKEY